MRVMVVDDASSVRQRLVADFQRSGVVQAVAQAASGVEALDLLDDFQPDLVILDLMMPGMNGIEVLEEIRRRTPAAKVVILTNYPYPTFRKRCLELGAFHFYGKSTDVGKILEMLQENPPTGDEDAWVGGVQP